MTRTSRQRSNKELKAINRLDTTDIIKTIYSAAEKYTFFSSTYETLSRLDHRIGHNTIFNKHKIIKIIQSMFSDHNGLTL